MVLRLFWGKCCWSLFDGDLNIQLSKFCHGENYDELNTFHLSSENMIKGNRR